MNDNVLPRERLEPLSKMLLDAERVVHKGASPSYTAADYEQAMTDLARYEADGVGSTAKAYARLLDEGDDRMEALYKAADAARVAAPSVPKREQAWDLLKSYASTARREDETLEAAVARLLEEDPACRDAYAFYAGE